MMHRAHHAATRPCIMLLMTWTVCVSCNGSSGGYDPYDLDGDGVPTDQDCDDEDELAPSQDADCDGSLTTEDCDDSDPGTYPGAAYAEDAEACMTDRDGDGWGAITPSASAVAGTDCDDASANTFPGAAQLEDPSKCMADEDDDGWGAQTPIEGVYAGSDCDDRDPSSCVIHTGARLIFASDAVETGGDPTHSIGVSDCRSYGDVDGDGRDDLLIRGGSTADGSLSWHLFLASQLPDRGTVALTEATLRFDDATQAASFVGDVDADGLEDLALQVDGGAVLFLGNTLVAAQTRTLTEADADHTFEDDISQRAQPFQVCSAGDLDRDGLDDIAFGGALAAGVVMGASLSPPGGSTPLSQADLGFVGTGSSTLGHIPVGDVDYNGDGLSDLVISVGRSVYVVLGRQLYGTRTDNIDGPGPHSLPSVAHSTIEGPSGCCGHIQAGRFDDQDDKTDLLIMNGQTGFIKDGVSLGFQSTTDLEEQTIWEIEEMWGVKGAYAGDLNGDRWHDVAITYASQGFTIAAIVDGTSLYDQPQYTDEYGLVGYKMQPPYRGTLLTIRAPETITLPLTFLGDLDEDGNRDQVGLIDETEGLLYVF